MIRLCFLIFTVAGDPAVFNAENIVGVFPFDSTRTEIAVVESKWTSYTLDEPFDVVLEKISACPAVQVIE